MTTIALALALLVQADPAKVETESKLKNLRISLDFQDAPLETVVDYLREIAGMNVFVGRAITERQLRVSIKVTDIALGSVFRLMLRPHGCDTLFKDGVLMVLTQEEIADKTVRMQIYDCRDILHPIQDFPGVDLQIGADGPGVMAMGGDFAEPAEIPIAELVRTHTGGRTWDDNPKASVALQNGLLVVKQTPEVHKQVVRLLNMLRANK